MKNNTHMRDKNILFIEFLNKKHKLFKHEQQETHLDTKKFWGFFGRGGGTFVRFFNFSIQ
jgi:hypothetical protein